MGTGSAADLQSEARQAPGKIRAPFLFGAQYYRAPTPEPECWETDLRRMRELGFNHVKFWVQWRWSHRAPDRFVFDDVDRLMDLAHENGLAVTLNTLFDVAPSWLLKEWPDSVPVTADGLPVPHRAMHFRQIGGFPGPCLNHPEAARARLHFLETAVRHYAGHPAMSMWDVWNEPEQNFLHRQPVASKLTCFCPHCLAGFVRELEVRYGSLEALNAVWGRCYENWDEIEPPRSPETIKDFIDFRSYHLRVMEREAKARIDCIKQHDPHHTAYLHVVPNTLRIFNPLTGVDDFAMADMCDVFAASTNGGAIWPNQLISAARGKPCYNVESHINAGQISMHQRELGLDDVLADLLPQIGAGITGFLFWQYRAEVLGTESPAWGVVKPDGSDRPETRAIREFGEKLAPHMEMLTRCRPEPAEIAIWKSSRNEIFHFSAVGELSTLADHVEGYRTFFRRENYPTRYINENLLERCALENIRLLILPCCYYLSDSECDALDRWVRSGGTLLCEAHLAAYSDTKGRHQRTVPGGGLARKWGIVEENSTSVIHLNDTSGEVHVGGINPDIIKALDTDGAGRFFPINLTGGQTVFGSDTCAWLEGERIQPIGWSEGRIVLAELTVGEGTVFYCGTRLGAGLAVHPQGAEPLLRRIISHAGIQKSEVFRADPGVQGDLLRHEGRPAFIVLQNTGSTPATAEILEEGTWNGLFSGTRTPACGTIRLAPGETELYRNITTPNC
jgi:beta-galactosidase